MAFYPLRSNAYALMSGQLLSQLRAGLKFASLLYDEIVLERGEYRVQAGPTGGSAMHIPRTQEAASWQSTRERGAAQGTRFGVAAGSSDSPDRMVNFVSSIATVDWRATFEPFARELPAGCDWISFGDVLKPDREIRRVADEWSRRDRNNHLLNRTIPDQFVRSRVITDTNYDLSIGAAAGTAVALDSLHASVATERARSNDDPWAWTGFALPIIIPDIGRLPWEAVVELRKERGLTKVRSALAELERGSIGDAANAGDLEQAVRRAYAGATKAALKNVHWSGVAQSTVVSTIVGGGVGFLGMGMAGPVGVATTTGISAVIGTVINAGKVLHDRRTRQWIGTVTALQEQAANLRT